MDESAIATSRCALCGTVRSRAEFAASGTIREPIVNEIRRSHPDWSMEQPICYTCLNRFRVNHLRQLLQDEKGELSALEEQVLESMREGELLSENVNVQFERQLTIGEKLSDRIAAFGGSWTFLIIFFLFVAAWMLVNTIFLVRLPFDPFPYILLNLFLSCLAAVQAPIILMSQKRQESKDRLRSEHDYRVDLKAEMEIRLLHAKVDQLLTHQWQRLLEIQELQMELMEDVASLQIHDEESKPGDSSP